MQNRLIATLGIAQSEYETRARHVSQAVEEEVNRALTGFEMAWHDPLYANTVDIVIDEVPVMPITKALCDE
jgi:hypothetical protein